MQQPTDLEAQALALLQTFPPPALSSSAIMQEVETILTTSSQPQADLAALKEKSWEVYLAQFTDNSTHTTTTTIYAPTIYNIVGSFNRGSFNDDHSDRSTTQTWEPNWVRGLLFALVAWILLSVLNQALYLDGYHDGRNGRLEVRP